MVEKWQHNWQHAKLTFTVWNTLTPHSSSTRSPFHLFPPSPLYSCLNWRKHRHTDRSLITECVLLRAASLWLQSGGVWAERFRAALLCFICGLCHWGGGICYWAWLQLHLFEEMRRALLLPLLIQRLYRVHSSKVQTYIYVNKTNPAPGLSPWALTLTKQVLYTCVCEWLDSIPKTFLQRINPKKQQSFSKWLKLTNQSSVLSTINYFCVLCTGS